MRSLNACSMYDFQMGWKVARRKGTSDWICERDEYKQWSEHRQSSILWLTGILGSAKTVVAANVVEKLISTKTTDAESLKFRTIIGSLARQLLEGLPLDSIDKAAECINAELDPDQILEYIVKLLPSTSQRYYILIDGLDECQDRESRLLMDSLKQLLTSDHHFQIFCSSQPNVLQWAPSLTNTYWTISMSADAETDCEIAQYIERELVRRIVSRTFRPSTHTIFPTIVDALVRGAKGMFLWVVFQLNTILDQDTDAAILRALEDLLQDLSETFDRILHKGCSPKDARSNIRTRILELVTAAQRPLSLDELCVAINVKIGETTWNAGELINDMAKTLAFCGSLLIIDEEHLTVRFAHHSIRQHIHSKNTNSDANGYYTNLKQADLSLGETCVTYLNLDIFQTQLTRKAPPPPQKINYSPLVLKSSLPTDSIASRLALKYLKTRGVSGYDMTHQPEERKEQTEHQAQKAHSFIPYAQEFWLFHTKFLNWNQSGVQQLWRRLLNGAVQSMSLPWAPEAWIDLGDSFVEWIVEAEHGPVLNLVVKKFEQTGRDSDADDGLGIPIMGLSTPERYDKMFSSIKKSLNERGQELDVEGIYAGGVVHMALTKGDADFATFLLRNTSSKGREAIVQLLLEKGADINAQGGFYDNALCTASSEGHEAIVRLLLEKGVDINSNGYFYGSALHAASYFGRTAVVKLLLKNGADINARGEYGTAMEAAKMCGHNGAVRLLKNAERRAQALQTSQPTKTSWFIGIQ
ncbi:MAG: hypothetical protein MMC33_004055 [Icmadophila ericetorum]|nr:hypothetical protein [Icmadophila ericetorum]